MASGHGSTSGTVWARVECVLRGDRGPYHWTEACLSRADAIVAELIVALSRVERRARVLPV